MALHEDWLVYPDIPSTGTPRRLARAVTSLGLCDDTKKPKAFDEPMGSEHPASVARASTSNAAPIPPLRMNHLPGATAPPTVAVPSLTPTGPCSRGRWLGWAASGAPAPVERGWRMPGMVHVRPARPDDAAAVAGVHVRSWQVGYRGLLPDAYLEAFAPRTAMDRYTFGATDPDVPSTVGGDRGRCHLRLRDHEPVPRRRTSPAGERSSPSTSIPRRGGGVGRRLMARAREELGRAGFTDVGLWVLVGKRTGRSASTVPTGGRPTAGTVGRGLEHRRRRGSLQPPPSVNGGRQPSHHP